MMRDTRPSSRTHSTLALAGPAHFSAGDGAAGASGSGRSGTNTRLPAALSEDNPALGRSLRKDFISICYLLIAKDAKGRESGYV